MSYDDDNVFAGILRGEAPCIKVYEDEESLAFMDIMPQVEGHVLVIPRERAVTLYDLSDDGARACLRTARRVAAAVERAMGIDGSTLFLHNGEAAGQTVPHIHFHVLPGSIFRTAAIKGHAAELADPADLEQVAAKIRAEIEADAGVLPGGSADE